jgi:hypothetical protein
VQQQVGADLRGARQAEQEDWIEDQKPCGRREGHVSIFRGVWRILSAGQKQMFPDSRQFAYVSGLFTI